MSDVCLDTVNIQMRGTDNGDELNNTIAIEIPLDILTNLSTFIVNVMLVGLQRWLKLKVNSLYRIPITLWPWIG